MLQPGVVEHVPRAQQNTPPQESSPAEAAVTQAAVDDRGDASTAW